MTDLWAVHGELPRETLTFDERTEDMWTATNGTRHIDIGWYPDGSTEGQYHGVVIGEGPTKELVTCSATIVSEWALRHMEEGKG